MLVLIQQVLPMILKNFLYLPLLAEMLNKDHVNNINVMMILISIHSIQEKMYRIYSMHINQMMEILSELTIYMEDFIQGDIIILIINKIMSVIVNININKGKDLSILALINARKIRKSLIANIKINKGKELIILVLINAKKKRKIVIVNIKINKGKELIILVMINAKTRRKSAIVNIKMNNGKDLIILALINTKKRSIKKKLLFIKKKLRDLLK